MLNKLKRKLQACDDLSSLTKAEITSAVKGASFLIANEQITAFEKSQMEERDLQREKAREKRRRSIPLYGLLSDKEAMQKMKDME